MFDRANQPGDSNTSGANEAQSRAPAISLPKGGGVIRGIGEKFAANPGTGSMAVPIATSPGRSGFSPQLSLSYDSGSGNGPFGFGWKLSLPSFTRKTDKGLLQYQEARESDVYILSGAEDLVPVLQPDGTRFKDDTAVLGYVVHCYRPRIEGLFARIERWKAATGEIHWRSITRDNITTLNGKDNNFRIFDPAGPDPQNPTRIFSWLICESYDDKGNTIVYKYAEENNDKVDRTQANERNRVCVANRYLKRIRYGNRVSRLIQPDLATVDWMFEVVFDYGEHHPDDPKPNDDYELDQSGKKKNKWFCRHDPFSSYRTGFEVQTYRLCQRVLMFHHFDDGDGVGNDCLVRSTGFTYSHEQEPDNACNPGYILLLAVTTQSGYKRHNGGYLRRNDSEFWAQLLPDTILPIGLTYCPSA